MPEEPSPYFHSDDNREAVGALEGTAFFLAAAEFESVMWRWVTTR